MGTSNNAQSDGDTPLDTKRQTRYTGAMKGIQVGFLIFTFASPVVLWVLSRHLESERFARGICRLFAAALVTAFAGTFILRVREDGFDPRYNLPMHLCDWALIATVVALTFRRQICFELAYFWGLSGTVQALITPAVDTTTVWRILGFFVIHSVIPAGVLWLMFEFKMRPLRGAYLRVFLWSEAYLVAALLVNAMAGANYGFLSERPATRSLLDLFSDTRWLYIVQINLTGLVLFFILDLPWQFVRRRERLAKLAESVLIPKQFKDYYAVLGVPKKAKQDEIRKAFRKLARQYHPDVAKDKKSAEGKFKELNEANEVLSDPHKRKKYDELGVEGKTVQPKRNPWWHARC
jgi:hypothetical integral membrane protein (TIGR02206 family)